MKRGIMPVRFGRTALPAALMLFASLAPLPLLAQARQVPETRQQVQLSFAPIVQKTAGSVVNV